MPGRRRWLIVRSDLAVGGRALLWLHHPLLPDFASATLGEEGLALGPDVPEPLPVGSSWTEEGARAYLVELLGLASFLRSAGLGIAPGDLGRIGRSRDGHPALGAPPVPDWRALAPGLAVSGVASIMGGESAEGEWDPGRVGQAALDGGGPLSRFASAALRSSEGGERPEGLLARWAREAVPPFPGNLLGMLYPVCESDGALGTLRPASATGRGGLFLARGAIRRRSEALPFVEGGPASRLEEGASLRRCVALLGKDPRGEILRSLADGVPVRAPAAGPFAILCRDFPKWDVGSRQAVDRVDGGQGLLRFETRESPPAPWEDRDHLHARLSLAEVSSCLYLPYASLSDSVAMWEEVARLARSDAGRFVVLAQLAASRFGASLGGATKRRSGGRKLPEDAVTGAAALLADGFSAAELAVAAGTGEEELVSRLETETVHGRLVEESPGSYRFADPARRRRYAARLPASARAAVVARLVASGFPEERAAVARLARGNPEDRELARRLFAEAAAAMGSKVATVVPGGRNLAFWLLERAPQDDPDLGEPVRAAEVLYAAGAFSDARRAAGRADEAELGKVGPADRRRVARLLSRLGHLPKALSLAGRGRPEESVPLTVRLLLDRRRDEEAEALLGRGMPAGLEGRGGAAASWSLLVAESAMRRHDFSAAERELGRARSYLDVENDREVASEAASTAGFLASDLGRPEEAALFFSLARDLTRDAGRQADARVDLAVAFIHQGRLGEAGDELADALAHFAATGDEERYALALGNRAELLLAAADFEGARSDLEKLLLHDRSPHHGYSFLYTASSLQRLALLEGDFAAAEALFRESLERAKSFPLHDAIRQIQILEAGRRLTAGDREGAAGLLEEAGRRPEKRFHDEALRLRLLRSTAIDRGLPLPRSVPALGSGEAALLEAEVRLAKGTAPSGTLHQLLACRSEAAPGAAEVAGRILEWAARFPAFFRTKEAEPLLSAGAKAAARAGLHRASGRFAELLAHGAAGSRREVAPSSAPATSAVADDRSTQEVFRMVSRVARTSLPVLILGETGTGKEVVAREVHRQSGRAGPFVAVNVASVPESLAEAELFGHARGAFTGADRDRRGLIEEASGGTLFLDEIGELPPLVQAKLLRVLQERSVRRVGEVRERQVDLRVVSATHRDLKTLVSAGSFRQDLYYRLAGAEVTLLPLRERPKDLAALIDRTLGSRIAVTGGARARLLAHAWPGNVRELLAALESAEALAAPGSTIEEAHLPDGVRLSGAPRAGGSGRGRYFDVVDAARKAAIQGALGEAAGNRTRAAALLGLSRQSLLYEMKKLRLLGV